MLFRAISIFILLFFVVDACHAQNALYKHYTVKDGLPSNKIYGILQDNEGRIWLGTDKGIARFNGKKFTTFTVDNGLPTNDVFYFYPDPEGRVWISDYSSFLTYIKNDTVHSFPVKLLKEPYGKKNFSYKNGLVYVSHFNNELIIGSENTVSVINITRFLRKVLPGYNPILNFGRHIYTYNGSSFVLHDYKGIYYVNWDRQEFKKYYYHPNLDSFPTRTYRFVPSIFNDRYLFSVSRNIEDSLLFFDMRTGAYRFIPVNAGVLSTGYTHLRNFDVFDNYIQINTNNGMAIIDTNLRVTERFSLPQNLQRIALNSIYKDRDSNYWVSTSNEGLYLIGRDLKQYNQLIPDTAMQHSSIVKLIYSDGYYYLINQRYELIITDKNFHTVAKHYLPPASNYQGDQKRIFLLRDSSSGHYLLSTRGIYYLSKDHVLHTVHKNNNFYDHEFLEYHITSLKSGVFDKRTNTVFFMNHNAIFRIWFDGKSIRNLALIEKRFSNILRISDNEFWLSDDLGNITVYDSTLRKHKDYKIYSALTNQSSDAHGNIIFTVEGKGLFCVPKNFTRMQQVYAGGDIQAVKTEASDIWLATNNAISHYHFNSRRYVLLNSYPNLGGLVYEDVYSFEITDSHITLLCDKGIISIPRQDRRLQHPDTAFTNSLRVYALKTDKSQITYLPQGTNIYKVDYKKDNTNFLFTCNSTSYLGQVSYRYYLEGNDQDWQSTSEEEISYPSLSPGIYTLHLKAFVQNTNINTGVYLFSIEVLPAWWQTWWFKALVALLVLGAIATGVYVIIRRNKILALRKANIEKRMASLELTALQSQMNPHFIFNALSSIQSFINSHDSKLAEELLQKFSMLIRLYLEFSQHQFINIKHELKALELYTSIEQMRFSNRFDVVIKVRNTTGEKDVRIPPMLVQPLVENAINHGLYHKKERGLLRVIFWIKQNSTIVMVDDDGIGREAAKKLRRKLFPSRGNKLIKDRIEVLKLSGIADTGMEIIDKKDKFGNSSGTRVILTLQKAANSL